jgi:hypothetical protein
MSNDDTRDRLVRIERHLGEIQSQVDAIAAWLTVGDINDAIVDALAIRGLSAQINEVIHQQRVDLVAIAEAQTARAAQTERTRADVTALLTQLHAMALRHAARLTSWERANWKHRTRQAQNSRPYG